MAGALGLAVYWPPATPDLAILHGWTPPGEPQRSPVVEIVEPTIDAAGERTPLWSGQVAGALAALPMWPERRGREVVAALAGAVAVIGVAAVSRWTAGSMLPALAAALALAFSASFWDRAAGGAGQPLAPALLAATLWAMAWWTGATRAWQLWLAGILFGLAVEAWPPVILILPGLGIWIALVAGRERAVLTALGPVALLGTVGLVHHALAIRTLVTGWEAAGTLGLQLTPLRDMAAWYGLFPESARQPILHQLTGLASAVSAELGPVGMICLVAGVVRLAPTRSPMLLSCAGAVVTVTVSALVTGAERAGAAALPAIWLTYPVVAAGVAWLTEAGRSRRAWIWTLSLVLTLSLAGFWANRTAVRRARHLRALVTDDIQRVFDRLPADALVVAGSPRLDRAVEAARVRRASPIRRIPQAVVWAALAGARPVFGSEEVARRVTRLDYDATPIPDQRLALTLSAYLDTLPDGFIVAAAAAPGFQRVAGPTGTPTFAAAGGREVLERAGFASYVFVGVIGATYPVVERESERDSVAAVALGAALDPSASWAPAAVRVVSRQRFARVDVNGDLVARVETGLVVAVISPQGRLEATQELELGSPSTIAPSVPEPILYRLGSGEPADESS